VPSKARGALRLLRSVVWVRLMIRSGRGKREKRRIRVKGEVIIIYGVVGILISLRGTAASNEVVNLSSVFRMTRIGLLRTML